MAFTSLLSVLKTTCFTVIGVATLLMVTSCAGLRQAGSDSATTDGSETSTEPARVLTPNPYLQSIPRISDAVAASFARGTEAMDAENWREAERIFQQLTISEPKLSGSWVNLGILHYQNGDFDRAESAWETALAINPLNFDAYNQLAVLKREQGDFQAAEKIYLNSLAKWSDNAETHCNLGILYDLYMGRWNQALAEYKECAALTEEPSRQLRGWIVDMERRIGANNN